MAAFAALMILVTVSLGNAPDYSSVIAVDAVWHSDAGHVRITYDDTSNDTRHVALEVLGLSETFHRDFKSSSFVELVGFDSVPANGWRAHPVVFAIEHGTYGSIQIKTEVHESGTPQGSVIYGNTE